MASLPHIDIISSHKFRMELMGTNVFNNASDYIME